MGVLVVVLFVVLVLSLVVGYVCFCNLVSDLVVGLLIFFCSVVSVVVIVLCVVVDVVCWLLFGVIGLYMYRCVMSGLLCSIMLSDLLSDRLFV